MHQYGLAAETETFESFSALLDSFYEAKERQERVRQRGADLIRTATTARDRVRRKLALQEKDYAATQERDAAAAVRGPHHRQPLPHGAWGRASWSARITTMKICAEVTIPLDPLLTPQQNAAKYYKRYTKAKTAEKYLREQMALARRDLAYLESILQEIQQAETEQDFLDIRGEMQRCRLHPQAGEKGAPAALQATGIQNLRRLPGAGGAEQPPERQADPEGRRLPGSLVPCAKAPRLPCDPLHQRR